MLVGLLIGILIGLTAGIAYGRWSTDHARYSRRIRKTYGRTKEAE